MLRTNPHRIHLYLLRPDGERGEFQSLGSANGFLPSLWQVLLAINLPHEMGHAAPGRVVGDPSDHWIAADARSGLAQLDEFVSLIARHPQYRDVDGLDQYLHAGLLYLSQAIADWEVPHAARPILCVDLSRLPAHAYPADVDHEAELSAFGERMSQVLRKSDVDGIESLLRFPERHLRFTDWKAWSGMFGLAQFEPAYFSAAFREPFTTSYIDHDYDEYGSEASLGVRCYRFRSGDAWGVAGEVEGHQRNILEPVWDRILRTGPRECSLVWIKRAGRYGLACIAGERAGCVLREPDLDEVHGFVNGVAIAAIGNRFGLLDTSGQWQLQPCFDEIHPFANGRAVVRRGSKSGFIDARGRIVIEPQFDDADDFISAGVARVRIGHRCGLVRDDGGMARALSFTDVAWSDDFSGWLCSTAQGVVLARADGNVWVDQVADAIEVMAPRRLIRTRRGELRGMLAWDGSEILPCSYEELTTRDVQGSGPVSAQGKKSQVRAQRLKNSPGLPTFDDQRLDIVARREARAGLLDSAGAILVPFEFAYIDALEPHCEDEVQLVTPQLMRVLSPPGNAAPRVGIWNIEESRCVVECAYDFVWSCLYSADGTYGFIVGNRNPKRGFSATGLYRVGLLRADGSVLVPQAYAWIAESTPLNRDDAMTDIRNTLFHFWSQDLPVRASVNEHGPLVSLSPAGEIIQTGDNSL